MNDLAKQLRSQASSMRKQLTRKGRARADAEHEHEHMFLIFAARLSANSSCIDIGASHGAVLRHLVRLAPNGHHYAFEPIPVNREKLAAQYPSVDVLEIALSDAEGEAEFNWLPGPESDGLSGLVSSKYPITDLGTRLTVRTARLDDLLPADYVPELIKIDVEGGEFAVIRGAMRTLTDHRPTLIIEYPNRGIPVEGIGRKDLYELLVGQLAYRAFDLFGNGPLDQKDFTTSSGLNFLFSK
jgi:FkbM family methyltransferase